MSVGFMKEIVKILKVGKILNNFGKKTLDFPTDTEKSLNTWPKIKRDNPTFSMSYIQCC